MTRRTEFTSEYNQRMLDMKEAEERGLIINDVRDLRNPQRYAKVLEAVDQGRTVMVKIRPADYNKKRLRATQDWIEDKKLRYAIKGANTCTAPVITIARKEGFTEQGDKVSKVYLVFVDGSHRGAVALAEGRDFYAKVLREYDFEKDGAAIGFNNVYAPIRDEIKTR